MLTAYLREGECLLPTAIDPAIGVPDGVAWIDLNTPTKDEEQAVERLLGVGIPNPEEMREIEESSRFYTENGVQFMTASVLHSSHVGSPGIAPITFILAGNRLVTLRYSNPKSFMQFEARIAKPGNGIIAPKCDANWLFLGLIEAITDRIADILENVASGLDDTSSMLFSTEPGERPMGTPAFREALRSIGKEGAFLSKVRESLAGINRMLVYLSAGAINGKSSKESRAWMKSLERDTQSLNDYVGFLSNKITFLLDTVVGLVSVEQNAIIKIFSVAAVVFMPPTLVASIYGMNFHNMPELSWLAGYPYALGLMLVSAILPILYFRRKGWL
ncbi:MAG: magnesium transporter CorA family protein [Rhizobiales bacterium]|jgi:magnesium transporter|nr:magnesium transporter CorA family protein [Hyphomicrobiales bacterium]